MVGTVNMSTNNPTDAGIIKIKNPLKALAMNCAPTGIPFLKPQGIEIAGNPAKLAGTVKRSCSYISTGLSTKELSSNAVDSVVGVKIRSTLAKAFLKSLAINLLTFCAFRSVSYTHLTLPTNREV